MKNFDKLSNEQIAKINMQGPLAGMFKTMIAGKYQYLSCLMCSTACFFFWMTPNHHKIRLIRPAKKNLTLTEKYILNGNSVLQKKHNDDIEMEHDLQ